jgi:hypothetical protein
VSRKPIAGWIPGKENYRPVRNLLDCALFKINLRVTCKRCRHSAVLDAPGHWWQCERTGLDDGVGAFIHRLYCSKCLANERTKVRNPEIEQTHSACDGPLLPSPDEYTWKRIVNRQRS